jgi:hypothetical protein
MSNYSHVYSRGYVRLEVQTLKKIPVPNPEKVLPATMRRILDLVEQRIHVIGKNALELENTLDHVIADLYDLDSKERKSLGMN